MCREHGPHYRRCERNETKHLAYNRALYAAKTAEKKTLNTTPPPPIVTDTAIAAIRSWSNNADRSSENAELLTTLVETYGVPSKPLSLYRGLAMDDHAFEDYTAFQPGDTITLPLSSFTSVQAVAEEFAFNQQDEDAPSVMLVLENGSGFPIEEYTNTPGQDEWLVTGKYDVVSVESDPERELDYIITVKPSSVGAEDEVGKARAMLDSGRPLVDENGEPTPFGYAVEKQIRKAGVLIAAAYDDLMRERLREEEEEAISWGYPPTPEARLQAWERVRNLEEDCYKRSEELGDRWELEQIAEDKTIRRGHERWEEKKNAIEILKKKDALWEEANGHIKERRAMEEEYLVLDDRLNRVRREVMGATVARFRPVGGVEPDFHENNNGIALNYVKAAMKHYPDDWVKASNDHPTVLRVVSGDSPDVRPCYVHDAYAEETVRSQLPDTTPGTSLLVTTSIYHNTSVNESAAHELIHRFENTYTTQGGQTLGDLQNVFLTRRSTTLDGERHPLGKVYDGPPMEGTENETGYPDHFTSVYTGKVYDHGNNYEVLSTAMESLYGSSYGGLQGKGLWKPDLDHRNFAFGVAAAV